MTAANDDLSTQAFQADALLFTRTGDRLRIRPVTDADRALLVDFFHHITAEDRRFRFLTTLKDVADDRIDTICRADYPAAISLLAFRDEELVAVATLAGGEDGKAEIALSTLPQWKARGISWTLLEHAIRFAREHGATQIVSYEHCDNRAAIQVEHDMGFGIRLLDAGSGEVVALKSL